MSPVAWQKVSQRWSSPGAPLAGWPASAPAGTLQGWQPRSSARPVRLRRAPQLLSLGLGARRAEWNGWTWDFSRLDGQADYAALGPGQHRCASAACRPRHQPIWGKPTSPVLKRPERSIKRRRRGFCACFSSCLATRVLLRLRANGSIELNSLSSSAELLVPSVPGYRWCCIRSMSPHKYAHLDNREDA